MATTGSPITVSTAGLLTLGENGQMSLPAAGKVGIGDATPDHLLDVAGNIGLDASGYINWGDTDGTSGYGFRDNAGTMEYKNSAGSWTSLSGGVATNFAAGTVSAPGLYVTGDTNTGFYQATADTLSATAGGVEAARFNTAASGVNYLTVTPSATTAAVQLATAGTDSNINLAIIPKGTGRVGIGTATPIALLDVYGDMVFGTAIFSGRGVSTADTAIELGSLRTGNGNSYIDFHSQTGTDYDFRLLRDPGANGGAAIKQLGTGTMALWTNGVQALTIDSTQKVGIGTATPAEKLEVSGNIKVAGTIQTADSSATCTTAADYGKFRYNPSNGKLQICKP